MSKHASAIFVMLSMLLLVAQLWVGMPKRNQQNALQPPGSAEPCRGGGWHHIQPGAAHMSPASM